MKLNNKKIAVLQPTADKKTEKELIKVLRSGWWGNGGKVLEFEDKFAKYVGAKYAVAVNSATSALDLCLKVYDIKGGELITTAFTFVSDAIVAEWNGMDCTFADIKEDDLCIDPEAIHITPDTKAIIAVDSHGRLTDIKAIKAKFSGLVIEDAAHAMYTPGAGRNADITVWSFQAVKSLPTGDGGMITTNDETIAKKLKGMIWLGVEKSTFDRVGQKYTWDYDITHGGQKSYMIDLTAVIGIGNLRRLEKTNARRRYIQDKYNKAFEGKPWFKKFKDSRTVQYYTQCFTGRDELAEFLAKKGITTSVHFKPLSEMTYYKRYVKRALPITNSIWRRILSLPVHSALTNKELNYIIKNILDFYENINDGSLRSFGQ